jgi:hypothetical protein
MAGFELDVRSDIHKLTKYLSKVERKVLLKVKRRSLNKTGITVNKELVRRIRLQTKLPAKRIKKKLLIRKARGKSFEWSIEGLRGVTNIIEWVPASKQVVGAFRKKQGVRSRAWGKRKTYPGSFIGRGQNSGKLLVFIRDSSSPSGVKDVRGPSVKRTFIQVIVGMKSVAERRFVKVFAQELNFELRKLRAV